MDRSKRLTLFASPDRPVHSDTISASPGIILAIQQLRATTKSPTFPPLSIARYSFLQLSQLGDQCRERTCPFFETVAKGDSNPGSLDCESGILPLSFKGGCWSRNCFAHFSTQSFHCIFIIISMEKYGEKTKTKFSRDWFPWKWRPCSILGQSPRYT